MLRPVETIWCIASEAATDNILVWRHNAWGTWLALFKLSFICMHKLYFTPKLSTRQILLRPKKHSSPSFCHFYPKYEIYNFFWMLIINYLVGSSLSCLINQPNLQPHLADSVWKLSVRSNDLLPIKGRRSGWTEFLEKNSLQATAYLLSGRPRLHIWILFYMSCISSSQYTC